MEMMRIVYLSILLGKRIKPRPMHVHSNIPMLSQPVGSHALCNVYIQVIENNTRI
jgi:hypothetical protein